MRQSHSKLVAGMVVGIALVFPNAKKPQAGDDHPTVAVSERAAKVHAEGMLFDGHNDLPWKLRMGGDVTFSRLDISKRLKETQTDIPRLRAGGVKAQFWSVFVPTKHPNPAPR